MLYSRHSAAYWLNHLLKGILYGYIFKYPEDQMLGLVTEGKPKYTDMKNPITRVYSKKQIKNLYKDFKIISLRKSGFTFGCLPLIGKLRNPILKIVGKTPHPGGALVYGSGRIVNTKLELYLGKYIGYNWNIICEK